MSAPHQLIAVWVGDERDRRHHSNCLLWMRLQSGASRLQHLENHHRQVILGCQAAGLVIQ